MRYHLALRSHVTIISAHGCVDTDAQAGDRLLQEGEGRNKPVLYTSSITNGAIRHASLLLIERLPHFPNWDPI